MNSHKIENGYLVSIEGVSNLRELGGYKNSQGKTLKYRKLLRSGRLSEMTDKDMAYLKEYGLKIVVDFRGEYEGKEKPNRIIPGVEYLIIPVNEEEEQASPLSEQEMLKQFMNLPKEDSEKSITAIEEYMKKSYREMIRDTYVQAAYRKFFCLLAENGKEDKSLLFHCAMGKDRTGFAAALILFALGFSEETVIEDYLRSNIYVDAQIDQIKENIISKGGSDQTAASIYAVMIVKQSYIEGALEEMIQMSGSIDAYLEQVLGVGSRERELLSNIYLE